MGGGRLSSYVTFIPYREYTWRISGMARANLAARFLGRTLGTSRSFRPLTDAERNSVDVTRLHTATAYPGESLEALGRRTDSAWGIADSAIYNGVFIDHRFEGLIDVGAKKAVHTMATGTKAITAVFSSDGKSVYVANAGDANISVVDVKSRKITGTLPGAKGAMALQPAAGWSVVWLTAPADNALLLIDPMQGSVVGSIDTPGEPHGMVFSPDGERVYLVQRKANQLAMIDTAKRRVTKTMQIGKRPDMIAISSDGETLYVTSRDEDKLLVVSAADLSLKRSVDTDAEPHGVAYRN